MILMMKKQVMDNNFSIGNLLLNNIVLILHKVKFVHDDDDMTTTMMNVTIGNHCLNNTQLILHCQQAV